MSKVASLHDCAVFRRNDVAVLANDAEVSVAKSLFIRNRIAIQVLTYGNESPCARLRKVVFVKNGVRLDGPRCPA